MSTDRLTYGIAALVLSALLALPTTASAGVPAITLGEGRAAINRYGSELAEAYDEHNVEPLEWGIKECFPHGSDRLRGPGLVCTIETANNWFHIVAENWRNPHHAKETKFRVTYGRVAIWTGPVKSKGE